MKRDIETRGDIELLVTRFYEKVKVDPVIGHIFKHLTDAAWERHLPVMFDFWENTIFFTGSYTGNPMKSHQGLHQRFTLTAAHFNHWVQLFNATVSEMFEGDKAELARQRATSISTVMQIKILHPPKVPD